MDQLNIGVTVDASRAVDGLGQVSKSIDKVETSTQRMNSAQVNAARLISSTEAAGRKFLAELKEEVNTYGQGREEALKYRAAQLGVSGESSVLISQLKNMHGGELKEAAGHMGEFSFASAGARRELLVLAHEISQGNWTRFGGSLMVIGERTNAMSLIFSSTGLAIGAVAAVVGVFALAIAKGAMEESRFNQALVLTGDYAGTTVRQMFALSQTIADTGAVTVGTAKDIAEKVAASGTITAVAYKSVVEATSEYARVTGQSGDDAVKNMVKLFDDPAKGALDLNKTMHLLTASQIEYIKVLQDSGREGEAQKQLADDLKDKFSSMNNHLGYLEKGWHAVRDAASGAWAAMMGFGEQKGSDAEARLDKVSAKLKLLQPRFAAGYDTGAAAKGEIAKLLDEQAALRKTVGQEQNKAVADAASGVKELKNSEIDAAYAAKTHAGEVAKLNTEIVKYKNLIKTNPEKTGELNALIDADKKRLADLNKHKKQAAVHDDPTKKILADQLKIYEDGAAKESALLASRNKLLGLYNGENLISIKDYYAAKKSAQEEDISNTLALYDKEIAALKAYSAKAAKATDRAEATGKINSLLDKKAKLEQSSMEAGIVAGVQEAKAFHVLGNQIGSVNAHVLELTGNLHAAAVIRFDQQNESIRKSFMANGKTEALAQLDLVKKYTIAQVDLNKLNEQGALIKGDAVNAEARIGLAQKAGAMTELGTLQAISVVRKKEADDLQAIYDKYKQIADASGNQKMIQDADNMKVALESLRAESDLVAQKFNTLFTDSFATAFEQFATGAKSASDAFKSFAQSVGAQISKLAAQQLSTQLFGGMFTPGSTSGGGGGGGAGWAGAALSILGGLFGGGGGGFGAGAAASTTAGSLGTTAFSEQSLMLAGQVRAAGGPVKANSPYLVGERGPEVFMPSGAGRIIPNHELSSNSSGGGGEGHTINVYISGSNNAPDVRRSASQGAREALAALSSAQRYA